MANFNISDITQVIMQCEVCPAQLRKDKRDSSGNAERQLAKQAAEQEWVSGYTPRRNHMNLCPDHKHLKTEFRLGD